MIQSQVIDFCLSQAQEGKALQTSGRDLKCHVHVHLSIPCIMKGSPLAGWLRWYFISNISKKIEQLVK
ncbi:hypothetical protein [Endozoicomonas sp. ISHI1]|uniref:hypothetical protein n=1 Tax=Endozoicomonas sp. ISHI1 TaxID=2825882 RepID=UPI0021493BA9|nr:hypothetical protein [Endozoicomonas sp. ISHI1]